MYDHNTQGAWVLSALIGNRFITKTYYFYTKKEATQLFRQFIKGEN